MPTVEQLNFMPKTRGGKPNYPQGNPVNKSYIHADGSRLSTVISKLAMGMQLNTREEMTVKEYCIYLINSPNHIELSKDSSYLDYFNELDLSSITAIELMKKVQKLDFVKSFESNANDSK